MEATADRMLAVAAQQFAEKGYSGASMRSIANATGTTQAAIYHHYPNKEALYLAVLARHLAEKTSVLVEEVAGINEPEKGLKLLVHRLLELADEDVEFRQLYLRELLEGSPERLAALAHNVFGAFTDSVSGLLKKLAPEVDANLLLLSIAGLACHHIEARKLSPFLSGSKPEHQQLEVLSEHISQLLLKGIRG